MTRPCPPRARPSFKSAGRLLIASRRFFWYSSSIVSEAIPLPRAPVIRPTAPAAPPAQRHYHLCTNTPVTISSEWHLYTDTPITVGSDTCTLTHLSLSAVSDTCTLTHLSLSAVTPVHRHTCQHLTPVNVIVSNIWIMTQFKYQKVFRLFHIEQN